MDSKETRRSVQMSSITGNTLTQDIGKINLGKRSEHKYIESYTAYLHALDIFYWSNSFIWAIIAVASGKRGVIVHSNGRGTLRRANPSCLFTMHEESGQYLRDYSLADGFEGVWDNRYSCFILDARDICRPEDRGYADEEFIVRHVPSWTNPTVQLNCFKNRHGKMTMIPWSEALRQNSS